MSAPITTVTLDQLLDATQKVIEQQLSDRSVGLLDNDQAAALRAGVDLAMRALRIAASVVGPDVTVVGATMETLVARLSEAWEATA